MSKYKCRCTMCGDNWEAAKAGSSCPNCKSAKTQEKQVAKVG